MYLTQNWSLRWLWSERTRGTVGRFPKQEARDVSLLRSVQNGTGAHPASCYKCVPANTAREYNRRGVKMAIHFHLVVSLRIGGAGPPLSHTSDIVT